MATLVGIVALLGLCVGSFLNVVIARVPEGRSVVRPRSACPQCAHAIVWRDNVPVLSWVLLRGRCRRCAEPIPIRYPVVEMATAALFGLSAAVLGPVPELPAVLAFVAGGVALSAIDLDCFRLPTPLVWTTLGLVLVALGGATVIEGDVVRLLVAVGGGAVLYGAFAAIAVAVPRGMGWGDVRLAAVLGVLLGWFGPGYVALGTMAAFVFGSVVGIVAAVAAGRFRRVRIPFGPSMVAGAFATVLWGDAVLSWYAGLLG